MKGSEYVQCQARKHGDWRMGQEGARCRSAARFVRQAGMGMPRLVCGLHFQMDSPAGFVLEAVDPARLPADLLRAYQTALQEQLAAITLHITQITDNRTQVERRLAQVQTTLARKEGVHAAS